MINPAEQRHSTSSTAMLTNTQPGITETMAAIHLICTDAHGAELFTALL